MTKEERLELLIEKYDKEHTEIMKNLNKKKRSNKNKK